MITEHVDCKLMLWKHLKRAYIDFDIHADNIMEIYNKFVKKPIPLPFTLEVEELQMIIENNVKVHGLNDCPKDFVWFVKHKSGV